VVPERGLLRCYERGKVYCRECAERWPRTMVELGVCPDCEEVFEAEEDYWDWE
jgi:Zn finger protein HypA/HybF involved in hydrogenase expression